MKPSRTLARLALSSLLVGGLLNPWPGNSAEETPSKANSSTEAADQEACQRQLNLIYGAIQEYRKRNQKLPQWLSDLTPEFIHDRETLVCPFVRNTGNLKKWRQHLVTIPVFGDPATSYSYEFCTVPIPELQDKTVREYKQRQMAVMGMGVPIVRCLAHSPWLNLAFDGNIYAWPGDWEDVFVKSKEYERFFHNVAWVISTSQNEVVRELVLPRLPQTKVRLLDLSNQYNALLLHLSQIDHSGNLLATYPEGTQKIGGVEFDIRGLVHLTGKNSPISFPERVDDIVVNQKCTRIHFLHGAAFPAPAGVTIATYVVIQGGERTEIPIVYGKDVNDRWIDARRKPGLDNPKAAWTSPPNSVGTTGKSLRLYHTSWANPNPALEVNRISFVSLRTDSAPFLVAITLE